MQDTESLKPKLEKKLSLSKQLHLEEPAIIKEEQEAIQQTSELTVTTPVHKAADEKQIPKADKKASKKSITTETPTNTITEVHFVDYELPITLYISSNSVDKNYDFNSLHIDYTGYRTIATKN